MVIQALKSWRQYLHGSPFSVRVFTNHKNLTYFCKVQSLNHRQACWLLDLADFNLKMVHVPGKLLFTPDALSTCPDLLSPDDDNKGITLLPPSMFVCVTDATLSTHPTVPPLTPIKSSCTHSLQQISYDLITNLPPSSSFDSLYYECYIFTTSLMLTPLT